MQLPKKYKEIAIWGLFIIVFIWALSDPRSRPEPTEPQISFREAEMYIRTQKDSKTLEIEVAETPEQQERGLMYRDKLPDGRGMLFLFPKEQPIGMWMKNTWIALDMLFIDRNYKIVCLQENTKPESEDIITCDKPIRAVLELPGGYSARHKIAVGDSVMYDIPPP